MSTAAYIFPWGHLLSNHPALFWAEAHCNALAQPLEGTITPHSHSAAAGHCFHKGAKLQFPKVPSVLGPQVPWVPNGTGAPDAPIWLKLPPLFFSPNLDEHFINVTGYHFYIKTTSFPTGNKVFFFDTCL